MIKSRWTTIAIAAVFATCFAGHVLFAQETEKIYIAAGDTDKLKAREGKSVIVYGETTPSRPTSSGTNFVNFKAAQFYLITFKGNLAAFKDGLPSVIYGGKRIAVEGKISIYRDKPQIKLTGPDMITILAEDEVFPPAE